jgi:hypothetical protein
MAVNAAVTADTVSIKLYGSRKTKKVIISKQVKTEMVADISNAMKTSGSIPEGYNGAEGKVGRSEGSLVITGDIYGNGPGIMVGFIPISAKDAEILSMNIKGDIQRDQSIFIGEPGSSNQIISIFLYDENGKMFSFEKPVDSIDDLLKAIKRGITLKLPLVLENGEKLNTIKQMQIAFPGRAGVSNLIIDDIKLLNRIIQVK